MHFAFRFQKLFNLRRIKKLRPPAASLFLPLPRQQCREITRHFRPEKPVDPSGIAPAVASVVRRAAASVQTHTFLRLGSLLHLTAIPVVMLALALPMMTSTAQAQTAVTLVWDANPETNIAGYKVYLGTSSGSYPQIQNVGNTTSTVLSGLIPATTYYCALQSYNTAGLFSELSNEISFTTQTTAGLFNTWATTRGLNGSAAAPAAMPFNDGVPNLLKYAFNLNAAGPDVRVLAKGTGTAGLPVFALERSGSQTSFKVEFLRRKNTGLVYSPKISTTMVAYEPMTGTTTVTAINDQWERVIIEKPCNLAITPKLFGRVEVTLPEITVVPEIAVANSAGTSMTDGTSTVAYGSASLGSSDSSRTITLSNTGTDNLTGLAITINGPNSSDFSVSYTGPATLSPGASASFTVTFKPTASGARNAALHIASNDADEAPFDIALTGSGATTAELFNIWAATGGLSNSAAAPAAMPFNDGVPNLLKYAFNLNAAGPDVRVLTKGTGTAGLPVFALERSGSQTSFKVEFLRRKGSNLVYSPKISTDLVNFKPMTGTTTVKIINDAWERVIIQKPCDLASTPKLFGRVDLTLP